MSISELIDELKTLQAAHGDVEVVAFNQWDELKSVVVWFDSGNDTVRVDC